MGKCGGKKNNAECIYKNSKGVRGMKKLILASGGGNNNHGPGGTIIKVSQGKGKRSFENGVGGVIGVFLQHMGGGTFFGT